MGIFQRLWNPFSGDQSSGEPTLGNVGEGSGSEEGGQWEWQERNGCGQAVWRLNL